MWSSQLRTQFKQLLIEAWKSQDFNGVWTRDLAIPVRRSNQLSYEVTDVGNNNNNNNNNNNKRYIKSQWIQPSTMASLIEETKNQTKSQYIKSNVGFFVRGENQKTRGKTSQNRVQNQPTQPIYDDG